MGLTSTRLSDRPGTSSADVLCFGDKLLAAGVLLGWESHTRQAACLVLLL